MTKRLIIAMTSLVAAVALALAIPLGLIISSDQLENFVDDLEVETLGTASLMSSQPFIDWQQTADATAQRTGARVVVVGADLTLIADSDDSDLDRSFDRSEIDAALAGELASSVRYSTTLGTDLRFVAAPIVQNYQVVAAVRLSLSESEALSVVRTAQLWLAVFVVSVVTAAGLLAWLLARSIARPVDALTEVVEKLPSDLSTRAIETVGTEEIRAAASALNQTAARLQGIVERTQRVAADASHHLRTPLTGVRLRLEAITDLTDNPDVLADAEAAINEVDRLAHRIYQILMLTRTDSGVSNPVRENFSQIIQARIEAAQVLAADKEIVITHSLEPCYVTVPIGTSARIIDELLSNALDYAVTRINVSLKNTDGFAVLEVSDDGPGLSEPGEVHKLFDRFYRSSSAVPGGSGLGLALVQESAHLAGGSAAVKAAAEGTSAEGGLPGLTVIVRLPSEPDLP